MIIEEPALREAITRIGQSPDGEMLYLWLQRLLTEVSPKTEPGALHLENGKRILARELMEILSAGINEDHAGSRYDRIIVFGRPEPAEHDAADVSAREYWLDQRRLARKLSRAEPEPEPIPGPGPFFNNGDAAS